MVTIYALLDNAQVRYIGKTKKTNLEEKLSEHIREAIEIPEKFGWINTLTRQGLKPEIKSIFTVPEEDVAYYEELFLHEFRHLVNLKPKMNAGI
jgi:hypothetical protein